MPAHILGIRHHGPGSAQRVREFLHRNPPDVLLVEGPPDANELLTHVLHADMQPPVAILAYRNDQPQQASFYPFAVFSPEWQAIRYGLEHNIPVRFIDLPLAHRFALRELEEKQTTEPETPEADAPEVPMELRDVPDYPLAHLARAAGFEDTELWWEHQFELRLNNQDSFAAILEGVSALRETLPLPEDRENDLREAYMRTLLLEAEQDFAQVAVVCGAWHAPALVNRPPQEEDQALLKGLPTCRVDTTWVPWTYHRLTLASGYGAGVLSPGWYHHLWQSAPDERGYRWMTRVAQVFRRHQMDTSTAHVIEAIRLADALASLRRLPRPGLPEYNEATNAVLSLGDSSLLNWVHQELIVGPRIGHVPSDVPAVPLQSDLQAQQHKLRLKPSDERKTVTLDLRKELDLKKSILLHRLQLLEIDWGSPAYVSGQGTFKEQWNLYWEPEMMIRVIEKGVWGNTVADAATGYVKHLVARTDQLSEVAQLLERALPADLPDAVAGLMQTLDALAAVSGDVFQLMRALPPLANVSRYGDVRQTNTAIVRHVLDGLVVRISIGLPNACTALDDDSAAGAYEQIGAVNDALRLLQEETYDRAWHDALRALVDHEQVHGTIAGKACRILSESQELEEEAVAQRFAWALSAAQATSYSAAWLEGFLAGSGTVLLLDEALWSLLHRWVAQLEEGPFTEVLPILRRSFSTFTKPERRKLGEKARGGGSVAATKVGGATAAGFNHERAARVLPTVGQLLGITKPDAETESL